MPNNLLELVESTTLTNEDIAIRTAQIHGHALSTSRYLDAPNFTTIHPDDLELIFCRYDGEFFDGRIRAALGDAPLEFGLSKRMTRTAGKTVCSRSRVDGQPRYEIAVSTVILFQCFREDDHRPVGGSGMVCEDRLSALQRILEHELVHLVEMLLWNHSSCSAERFQSIALRFFGHVGHTHNFITPRERAIVKYGIQPGMAVRFRFDGVEYQGMVNRINKRATVLVESSQGQRYSDGKRYTKYYVPVPMLEAIE